MPHACLMTTRKEIDFSPKAEQLLQDLGSARVNQALERYADILRRERAARLFSENEWIALREALDGFDYDIEPSGDIAGWLWRHWDASAGAGIAEKWHVQHDALRNRLRALTYVQEVAVIEDLRKLKREQAQYAGTPPQP